MTPTAEPTHPNPTDRKPTPTERLHEVTLAALNRRPMEPESSVELTRNAKGDVQIGVTVRAGNARAAMDEAVLIFDTLCDRYPRVVEITPAEAKRRAALTSSQADPATDDNMGGF